MRRVASVVAIATMLIPLMSPLALAEDRDHWHGDMHRFHEHDADRWHGGRWYHAYHAGRVGWWWVVGNVWYWYPAPVYPYPDPYLPPGAPVAAAPTWYWCASPAGYYPYVAGCMVPWQAVPAGAAQPPVAVAPPPAPAPAPAPAAGGIEKSTVGTIAGAGVGALAGSQFGKGSGKLAATAIGTLLGAFIGHQVGESLDEADQRAAQQAAQRAYQAPLGQQITWNNPDSGHSGTITASRDGTDTGGNYCREFQQTVTVGGNTEQAFGTACRMPDGTWKIVNQ